MWNLHNKHLGKKKKILVLFLHFGKTVHSDFINSLPAAGKGTLAEFTLLTPGGYADPKPQT